MSRLAVTDSARLGSRTPWASVAASFIVAGAAVRLLAYFSQGQLYVDDAALALNIASRSFAGLTRPLDYHQVASFPFLWAEKLVTQVGGTNEYALRLIPLLAGTAVVVLLWTVGRRALGDEGAVLATCLGAFSTLLISYTTAVKQYCTDALVTLLLLWLVLEVLRAGGNRAAWWRLAAGGAAALWLSHPAVFVLIGTALALPASPAVRAEPAWQRRYALTVIVWAGAFALIYFLTYQTGEKDTYLQEFWEPTFLTPGAPNFLPRVRRAARLILQSPLVWTGNALPGVPFVLGGLTSVAFLAGLVSMFRTRGPSLALLCAGPYAALLGAAILGKYPPAIRTLLFAAPLLFFIYASALCWAAQAFPPRARGPALAAALALLTLWRYPSAVEEALHPQRRRETKTLVRVIETRAPHAPVYLLAPSFECVSWVWAFYTTDWSAPDTARLGWFVRIQSGGVESSSAERAVPVAAAGMSFTNGHRQDLIGADARMKYVRGGKWWPERPDPEWVRQESERIGRAANPVAWLWATENYPEAVVTDLLHGIGQRGGRLIFAAQAPGAAIWEVEFLASAR